MTSSISKRLYRHISQTCCPWNVKFSEQLTQRAFDARPVLAGKDVRTLARKLLQMSQAEFSTAFKNSPMKRAKLRGLQRNAVVALGNVGTDDDVPLLEAMLHHDDSLLRDHAAWALTRVLPRAVGTLAGPTTPILS